MIVRELTDPTDVAPPLPRISAVVCTHNRHALAERAVDSLLRQQIAPGLLEIVIVDNSSQRDESERFAARYAGCPSVHCLRQEPLGLSRARNFGVDQARAPIVAFLDDDATAAADWAAEMLAAFDGFGDQAGVVGGPVHAAWLSSKPDWLYDDLLEYLSIVDRGDTLRAVGPDEWLAGCNIAYRKAALIAAGGFSPALGRTASNWCLLSNEDLHATEAVRAQGLAVIYAPAVRVEHWIDPTRLVPEWFLRRAAWQAVSDLISNDDSTLARIASAEQRMARRFDWKQRLAMWLLSKSGGSRNAMRSDVKFTYDYVLGLLSGSSRRPL